VPGVVYQFRLNADGSSSFPYASEAIRQIYRVEPEEVRTDAAKVFTVLHPDDIAAVSASIQASAANLTPWVHEYRVKSPDGTVRWLAGNASPRREPDGATLWHGFITDITERKAADAAVAVLSANCRRPRSSKASACSRAGLRTTSTTSLPACWATRVWRASNCRPSRRRRATSSRSAPGPCVRRDLCKQMLANSGKGRFVVRKLDLNGLVEETTQLLQLSISKHAVLRFNLQPKLAAVEVDATQIRQVIMNLVAINASEAIGTKSGVISLNTGLTRVDRAYLGGTISAPESAAGHRTCISR